MVDRLFYRERYGYLEALERFTRETQSVANLQGLSTALTKAVALAMEATDAYLLLSSTQTDDFVLHSFTHLASSKASPQFAKDFIERLASRLRENGYDVLVTPFGYVCEWDLSVYGESLAKVYKEV